MKPEYIVSACLVGHNCRYDGGSSPCEEVIRLVKTGRAIPVCPEAYSGLPVPRPPCEQKGEKVVSKDGKDVTAEFEKGANKAFEKALAAGCKKAILKARSPSCGVGQIYDGSFSKTLVNGNGLFAQKLINAGFEVYDEEHMPF